MTPRHGAQAARLGGERGGQLSRGRVLSPGHLGERALAAGQRDHQVLVAVLGADDARLADGQAGLPGDPAGGGAERGHSVLGSSSRASRAAMTGAAAPSRSSTCPNSPAPPPQGSGMSPSPASVSPPASPNSRILPSSWSRGGSGGSSRPEPA